MLVLAALTDVLAAGGAGEFGLGREGQSHGGYGGGGRERGSEDEPVRKEVMKLWKGYSSYSGSNLSFSSDSGLR